MIPKSLHESINKIRMQGRTGWDKVLDVQVDQAIRAASATLPDAGSNIQQAGEFYKLIGHFL